MSTDLDEAARVVDRAIEEFNSYLTIPNAKVRICWGSLSAEGDAVFASMNAREALLDLNGTNFDLRVQSSAIANMWEVVLKLQTSGMRISHDGKDDRDVDTTLGSFFDGLPGVQWRAFRNFADEDDEGYIQLGFASVAACLARFDARVLGYLLMKLTRARQWLQAHIERADGEHEDAGH